MDKSTKPHTHKIPNAIQRKKKEYLLSRVLDALMTGGSYSFPELSRSVGGTGIDPEIISDNFTRLEGPTLPTEGTRLARRFFLPWDWVLAEGR